MNPDEALVSLQLGRPPRGRWRVAARCVSQAPLVIAVAPVLEDGSPFPTTFWLTCPQLVAAVHDLESAGENARFSEHVASDVAFADAVAKADAAYREARRSEGDGTDPCESVGIAGQVDPLAVKCLHARLAAFLSGLPDPIGEAVAAMILPPAGEACADTRCQPRTSAG